MVNLGLYSEAIYGKAYELISFPFFPQIIFVPGQHPAMLRGPGVIRI